LKNSSKVKHLEASKPMKPIHYKKEKKEKKKKRKRLQVVHNYKAFVVDTPLYYTTNPFTFYWNFSSRTFG
jgi:hypothetical protein